MGTARTQQTFGIKSGPESQVLTEITRHVPDSRLRATFAFEPVARGSPWEAMAYAPTSMNSAPRL